MRGISVSDKAPHVGRSVSPLVRRIVRCNHRCQRFFDLKQDIPGISRRKVDRQGTSCMQRVPRPT